MNENTETPQV